MKVGSLRWLEASASQRWSSIKLHDVWLLLLRCFILILLAVALAQPVWVHQPKAQGQKAVYVGQELLYNSAREVVQPMVNSLLLRGYSLHTFTAGFPQIPQEAWQQLKNRTQDSTFSSHSNYWSLLPALATKYENPQDSVWLFTSDQQQHFAGTRPEALPENIRWLPIATTATADWLQAAVQTSPDSLLLLVGHSTREGNRYSRYHTSASARSIALPDKQQLRLQLTGDSLQASIGNSTSHVKVQTEPLQVSILASKAQQEEVPYLKAALQAIGSYTGQPISIIADTAKGDWVFWLQQTELPQSIKQRVPQGLQVWVQPGAESSTQKASMALADGSQAAVKQVSFGGDEAAGATALWATTGGEQLLSAAQIGKGMVYTFRSGFSPAWSELSQGGALPELLLPLLFQSPKATQHDLRAVDEQQLMPPVRTSVVAAVAPEAQRESLLKWVVLAAFVLFLIERFIAGRRSKYSHGS